MHYTWILSLVIEAEENCGKTRKQCANNTPRKNSSSYRQKAVPLLEEGDKYGNNIESSSYNGLETTYIYKRDMRLSNTHYSIPGIECCT